MDFASTHANATYVFPSARRPRGSLIARMDLWTVLLFVVFFSTHGSLHYECKVDTEYHVRGMPH